MRLGGNPQTIMAGCCSALYFLNLKGDVLIQRTYRDDVEYGSISMLAFTASSVTA